MNKILIILAAAGLTPAAVSGQNVLFDFDTAPVHTSLPISLTVGGITAHLSATGQGFSIQPASSLGFTPAGVAGYCLYPNSVFAADLLVSFSTPLTDFSILYSPQELACDSSATMEVTAYLDGALVGTATTNATYQCTCTWPGQTLAFSSTKTFNSVVVHYVAPGPGCQDYGPIFLADNMQVTPAPTPMMLSQPTRLPDGSCQFAFTSMPGTTFRVLACTNPAVPVASWSSLGSPTEISSGLYQFTDTQATNSRARFYFVLWP